MFLFFQAYYEYMIDVASYLGADPAAARAEMLEVLRFEMSLANFSLPREERRNASKLYNPMRVRDLSKFDPNTPWLDYINNILTPDIIQVRSTLEPMPRYRTKLKAEKCPVYQGRSIYLDIQGDPKQVPLLPEALVQSYVDRFQNALLNHHIGGFD